MKTEEFNEIASTIRKRSLSYQEFGNAVSGIANSTQPLKNLIGEPGSEDGNKGSRLIAAGIALIAFPDPTITDLIGASLVAAGLIKNRTKKTTIADAYGNFQDVMKELKNIKRELTLR